MAVGKVQIRKTDKESGITNQCALCFSFLLAPKICSGEETQCRLQPNSQEGFLVFEFQLVAEWR